MAYNTKLADKIREALVHLPDVEEKEMFRGVCFMVGGKMCICVSGDEILGRIGAEAVETAIEQNGVRQMINNGRVMKDYVFVGEEAYLHKRDFDNWIKLALDFNPQAKASKKKK
ncbi:TfoX/Sxy family protein [Mucilaginibacter sp.]|uniref:TfoX/Sxy family protein n=1 Tax=Mucilaginibacter sp. TaxID=1882438 RepID=UPI003D0B6AF6